MNFVDRSDSRGHAVALDVDVAFRVRLVDVDVKNSSELVALRDDVITDVEMPVSGRLFVGIEHVREKEAVGSDGWSQGGQLAPPNDRSQARIQEVAGRTGGRFPSSQNLGTVTVKSNAVPRQSYSIQNMCVKDIEISYKITFPIHENYC